ncbi:coiled-coil domain-containing protein 30 [Myripristis murdjan]|uniref:coiled-coil domain-containing protein 30 n=1 Tax=Myripristis murdjan TaxID=586833 RepID=UPI001175EF46|nr:coiled-coil domain-containing protein 30-like [Myripristis murdjan]
MDQEEELQQVAAWLKEEGCAPHSTMKDQLCFLWRALRRRESRLLIVSSDLDSQRSQHIAEMDEVRKSLEQIRIFTEHKDVLAQEIQEENDRLKDQLHRLISLQDAQISEVAKMLYQQGLTELIHSSPSEQVAYLLVERASLLERREDPDGPMGHGDSSSACQLDTEALSSHQGAPHHSQSPWKRLFGLHKAAQSKRTFIPAEARHLAGQASNVQRECFRLERDLEEGSRRLAMAHNEIRRLTDELESAHLTQKAYEPELQEAQKEVEQLRHEVEKLKKREMVELRKAKELNDHLDQEIRVLRARVRSLDAGKSSLLDTVVSLQKEVCRLQAALQEQQQQQQLLAVQDQAVQATEQTKSEATEPVQSNKSCKELQEKLTTQARCLLAKDAAVESLQKEVCRLQSALKEQQQLLTVQDQADQAADQEQANVQSLKQQLGNSNCDTDNIAATVCSKENHLHDQKRWKQKEADIQHYESTSLHLDDSYATQDEDLQTQLQLPQSNDDTVHKECPDNQNVIKTLLAAQDECERLKEEICETLKCLDKERSKCHEMNEKHKTKLNRAKQRLDDETKWRDDRIKNLERELSLCAHSLAKEKELIMIMTVENEKLLTEKRELLQQLNEEEHIKNDSILTASLSKNRVDFLEMENRRLGNRILKMSNQLSALERTPQNMRSQHFAEELKKILSPQCVFFTSSPLRTSTAMMPEASEIQDLLDSIQHSKTKQMDSAASPLSAVTLSLPRPAEMGYLNLTSPKSHSEHLVPSGFPCSTDDSCS